MQKLAFSFTAIWISTLLVNTISVRGMETHEHSASRAEKYNKKNPLLLMPDILSNILLCCHIHDTNEAKALAQSIKFFIRLSCTCKSLNAFLNLETIGNLCKNYAPDTKNLILQKLIQRMAFFGNQSLSAGCIYNAPILIIIHALEKTDQKEQISSLLGQVIYQNNLPMLKKLYVYKVNLNITVSKTNFYAKPLFFYANTIDMVQLFINDHVNLQAVDECDKNVLWHVVENNYPSELIWFYLKQGVDATQRHPTNGSCLLHEVAVMQSFNKAWDIAKNLENSINQGNILLNAMTGMVNALNHNGQTPLYLAQKYNAPAEIIRLFTIYDGRAIPKFKPQNKAPHDHCAIS